MDIKDIKYGTVEEIQEKYLNKGVKIDSFVLYNRKMSSDVFYDTPLHVACSKLRLDMVKLFVSKGHPINAMGFLGSTTSNTMFSITTPIHSLFFRYNLCKNRQYVMKAIEILRFLCENGADINARTGNGTTVFHALGNSIILFDNDTDDYDLITELLIQLLESGADPMIQDNKGKTIVDVLQFKLSINETRKAFRVKMVTFHLKNLLQIIKNYMTKKYTLFGLLLPIVF